MRKIIALLFAALACAGCTAGKKTAVLWTDCPEFALYGEYFNSAQDQYKIEIEYYPYPARVLAEAGRKEFPDLAAGSWLKSSATRSLFSPLDKVLGAIRKDSFYPSLLALGAIEGRQYLLPVSFNAPALVFSLENSRMVDNPFVITFDEIRELGKAYNTAANGVYTRLGFAPASDDEFVYLVAGLLNANFREANPIAWDSPALERAVAFIRDWINEANGSIQAEDDFVFKYFYTPQAKLALSGRILFGYMKSQDLFTLHEELRSGLDFRWIANERNIPLYEGSVYMGLCKKGRAKGAARAFIQWFFNEETQRSLLEASRKNRTYEHSFGIGNGFSALRTVTEGIYPRFYPQLLGHMPPQDYLTPPNILPYNWLVLKNQVIFPFFHERLRASSRDSVNSLERRVGAWYRTNPVH
ncbi:MAG: ABC transporter substrate-binding protein [Spirochaetaceae bacterium]|jgi:ABC-type glycerol-3-phosphate transport system substrate-binding protein|nr:ABC transporter substrate-binding protein [Spirochaetaceae bacterium]